MQSRFACGPQLRVRVISVISELYFVASGSVFLVLFLVFGLFVFISLFLLVFFLFNLFSLDYDSAEEARTLHDRLKIIEEVEKNPGEKRVYIAKRLGLAASTLNSIFAKKEEIRQQIVKCGNACKKRKTGKESKFAELETVLFTWYQQARASNIPFDGTTLREKSENYSRPAEHR